MLSYKGGGGFDLRKYLPLSYYAQSLAGGASYADVFSYTGEGFISLAAVGTGGNTMQHGIKIIADGVTVFDGMTIKNQYSGAGVCQLSDIEGYGSTDFATSSIPFIQAGNIYPTQTYPYTGGSIGFCVLNVPIFFKTSLVVQAKTTTSTISKIAIQGGKKE